jgi:hypothetical protein
MLVHVFGAYFGLAVSCVLRRDVTSEKEGANYNSDIFAMIGNIPDRFSFVILPLLNCFCFSFNCRNYFLVAVLAQFQCWIGRRRRPTPGRHQHVLLVGRLLRDGLCHLRISQQRTQIRYGNFQVG